jgi:hypothetical protein
VSPVRYALGLYIPKDDFVHSHTRDTIQILQIRKYFFICEGKFLQFNFEAGQVHSFIRPSIMIKLTTIT